MNVLNLLSHECDATTARDNVTYFGHGIMNMNAHTQARMQIMQTNTNTHAHRNTCDSFSDEACNLDLIIITQSMTSCSSFGYTQVPSSEALSHFFHVCFWDWVKV